MINMSFSQVYTPSYSNKRKDLGLSQGNIQTNKLSNIVAFKGKDSRSLSKRSFFEQCIDFVKQIVDFLVRFVKSIFKTTEKPCKSPKETSPDLKKYLLKPDKLKLDLDKNLSAEELIAQRVDTYSKEAYSQRHSFNVGNEVGFNTKVLDGFQDAGRGTPFHSYDNRKTVVTQPSREIILVDRDIDPTLRKCIKEFKTLCRESDFKKLSTEGKLKQIKDFVRQKIAYNEQRLPEEKILLGDIINKGKGVCRHQALLFKILADEAGIEAKLIRGNFNSPTGFGGHAWNEVKINGQSFLFDITNEIIVPLNQDGKVAEKSDSSNYLLASFYRDAKSNKNMYV